VDLAHETLLTLRALSFVTLSLLNTRQQTSVVKKNLNPVFNAVFDFPLYLSLADNLGAIELVVWDKDMLSKDYLGEVALPLEDWFQQRGYEWSETAEVRPLHSYPPKLSLIAQPSANHR